MDESSAALFNKAEDGTAYWTLSIYVRTELLDAVRGGSAEDNPGSALRRSQLKHLPSMALRNAIDPLFNDIADRDFFGESRDFLFAAGWGKGDSKGQPWASPMEARNALLKERHLTISLPDRIEWTTEGIIFECHLPKKEERKLELRRFWFAHSDGALSYHLSFAHHYGANRDPFDVGRLYFLSLLQKLAAPKEFSLSEELLQQISADPKKAFSVFSCDENRNPIDLGISPLDGMHVSEEGGVQSVRFWHFVHDQFVEDAAVLFDEVLEWKPDPPICADDRPATLSALLEPRDVIEVPGLQMPRCRYMFHIDDKHLFDRLLPCDPETGEALPRKRMVRDQCYRSYRMAMAKLMRPDATYDPVERVHLGTPPDASLPHFKWERLQKTNDYQWACDEGFFIDANGKTISEEPLLRQAVLRGEAWQTKDVKSIDIDGLPLTFEDYEPPIKLHIPAYETGRPDCVDYMFLSGFNQNIIDWLNQDTSEILDSLDPIYPTEDLEADERFFVRYANHRGLLTYVSGSRSLEIGNDYIGTCPYAFLIHVLAMHNEFLARDHEQRTADALARINRDVEMLRDACDPAVTDNDCGDTETLDSAVLSGKIEQEINHLKRDSYLKYERHRYLNIFRYNTEGDVFKTMAERRGTEWRGQAMDKALETLEEYAADIDRRQADADRKQAELDRIATEKQRMAAEELREAERQRRETEKAQEEQRGRRFNVLLGVVGAVSGVGVVFDMAEWIADRTVMGTMPSAGSWIAFILGNFAFVLSCVGFVILGWLGWLHRWEAVAWLLSLGRSRMGRTGKAVDTDSASGLNPTATLFPPEPKPGSPPTGSP